MSKRIIPPKDEIEVYVGLKGDVCIKQTNYLEGEKIIVVHPSDVPQFIQYLQEAHKEALEFVPEDEDEDDE